MFSFPLRGSAQHFDFYFYRAAVLKRMTRGAANRTEGTLNARLNLVSAYLVLVTQNVAAALWRTLRDARVRQTGHGVYIVHIAALCALHRISSTV